MATVVKIDQIVEKGNTSEHRHREKETEARTQINKFKEKQKEKGREEEIYGMIDGEKLRERETHRKREERKRDTQYNTIGRH